MALTVGVLGFAWYQKLKPASATDDCGCAIDAKPAFTQSRLFLGIVTGLAVLLLAVPWMTGRACTRPRLPPRRSQKQERGDAGLANG